MNLGYIKLSDPWAKRNLLLASKEGVTLSPASTLLRTYLIQALANKIGRKYIAPYFIS